MEARRLVVTGYVQGIGYRYAMARAAQGLGVTGWVRNRNDGSVEAMVCGNAEQLAAIIAWARRGPSGAEVAQVAVEPGDGDYSGFEQRPTV
ncbi:MAG: acylphosphatase [Rhodocyclaceae bacterium]|nr:acylphosphatase [Rhodocyclaceae bacterium]